jgi:hypothetical protein
MNMALESKPDHAGHDHVSEPAQPAIGTFSVKWSSSRTPAEVGRPPAASPAAPNRLSMSGDSAKVASRSPSPEREIETDDWDSLFGAVEDKLRESVEGVSALGKPPLNAADPPRNLKAIVLDCVTSLEYLHASLKKVRGHQDTHLAAAAPTGIDPATSKKR